MITACTTTSIINYNTYINVDDVNKYHLKKSLLNKHEFLLTNRSTGIFLKINDNSNKIIIVKRYIPLWQKLLNILLFNNLILTVKEKIVN